MKSKYYFLSDLNENIRLIGRAYFCDGGLACDHSASGFELCARIDGELLLTASSSGDTYYSVFVDGERIDKRFHVDSSMQTVRIAEFNDGKAHKVKVLKQSESAWSSSVIVSLELDGEILEAPAERGLLFEFLGDSLTTGYGNLGVKGEENEQGGNTPHKEDATKTYAFLTAEEFDADCTIVAWSGVGLDTGWTHAPFTDYYKAASFHRDTVKQYEFGRAPDLLVIHLGANDSTNDKTQRESFVKKGIDLINYIFDGYRRRMPVIWLYDPDEGVPSYIADVLEHFGGESAGFFALELEWQSTDAYWGASGHPSALAHEYHAELLIDLIRKKNILK